MGLEDHSKTFLLLAFICWSLPSWLKVGGGNEQLAMWWVAHVIIVSAPVQNIGFLDFSDLVWTQGQDYGPDGTGDWGLGLGLDCLTIILSINIG